MKQLSPIFLTRIKKIYSKPDLDIIFEWFKTPKRNTTFRVNTIKSTNQEIEKILWENWIEFEKISFLKNGYILVKSWKKTYYPDINNHLSWVLKELFISWKIYLQSISSQIPVQILDTKEGDKILDITASPWGKTSQVAAKLWNSYWEIVAVDNNAVRIEKLKFTIEKQWCKNIKILKEDAKNITKNHNEFISNFDKIIADLPCSAEWKFNLNNEKSFAYWNENIVKKNYKLQKEIIKSIIPLLKEWWELVYSTCTISPEENEGIVHMILCNFPEMELQNINLDFEFVRPWILKFENKVFKKEVKKTLRILPSVINEGFFVAKFKKKEKTIWWIN